MLKQLAESIVEDKKKISGLDGKIESAVGDIIKTQGVTKHITDSIKSD